MTKIYKKAYFGNNTQIKTLKEYIALQLIDYYFLLGNWLFIWMEIQNYLKTKQKMISWDNYSTKQKNMIMKKFENHLKLFDTVYCKKK